MSRSVPGSLKKFPLQKLQNFAGFFELLVVIENELLRSYEATLAALGST